MTRRTSLLAFFFLILPAASQAQEDRPPVFAHYMPWYASKEHSGKWGWHWTMDHFDPEVFDWDGRREAASRDYPMLGLYDSGDPEVLETQVLLMKYAGIDGVIIDWYGTKQKYDFATIHKNTLALVPILKRAELQFALCYEDQSVGRSADGAYTRADGVNLAKEVLGWAAENWFSDEAYLKVDGQPALLVFGPQYFEPKEWIEIIATLQPAPKVWVLPHLKAKTGATGAFGWPPVDGGKNVSPKAWGEYLQKLYEDRNAIGVAFPGFHDIYGQAGQESYGFIDDRGGDTFRDTFELALEKKPPLIQIATWNDYGEGTVIEPTQYLGYRYLDYLQEKLVPGPGFSPDDLRLPVLLYQLRKQFGQEADADLDQAAEHLFAGQPGDARPLLERWKTESEESPAWFPGEENNPGTTYRLATDILYRDGEENLDDYARTRCRLDVYYPEGGKDVPVVVWFHGGGIMKGNRAIPVPLREKGVIVVAVNYRMNPRVKSPVYLEDAAASVAWTFKNITKYGGSPESIVVSGHSAGGYLTSMVGLEKKWLAAFGVDANRLAGLAPFSGQAITHTTIRQERGISSNQPVIDEYAPLFHIRKDASPLLLITGGRKRELRGRYEENAYFWRMMKVVGHPDVQLKELEGFHHGNMPEPAFPLLVEFADRVGKKSD